MQVILSVPVPSDKVISPLAIPWSIISSIIKDVSPFPFPFLIDSDFDYFCKVGTPDDAVEFDFVLELDITLFYLLNLSEVYFPFLGPFSLLDLANFAAYSLVKQSQMPSHAIMMKSCSGLIGTFFTSGNDDTWCFFDSSIFLYGTFFASAIGAAVVLSPTFFFFAAGFFSKVACNAGFLYSQSPIALETAIIPDTRLSSTKPPAALIRFISPSLSGLWSCDSSVTFPALLTRIALESPEFAQKIVSGVSKQRHAVQPALNGTDFISRSSVGSNFAVGPRNSCFRPRTIYLSFSYPSSAKSI